MNVDHLSDKELAILGYTLISENEEFKIYQCYDGSQHITDKGGRKYFYVDDVNDAIAMQSSSVLSITNPPR